MRSFSPPVFRYGWWLLAAALCALAAVASVWLLIETLSPRAWPEVPARVVACKRVGLWLGCSRLEVQYRHNFNGESHAVSSVGFVGTSTGAKLADLYQPGRAVVCYVNPNAPDRAVLRREVGLLHWLLPGMFGLAVAGLIWGGRRALAQQRLADIATLYSLETGELVPVGRRDAA